MVGAEVHLPTLDSVATVPQWCVYERSHARGLEPVIQLGDTEELKTNRRAAAVACEQREARREATSSALAPDTDAVVVDAEFGCIGVQPREGGVAVLDSGRERVLGRQSIFHRGDDDSDPARQRHSEPVLHLDGAGHEATAVYVE